MGAVYEAEHVHMRKRVAVKVLHPEMSRMPEIVERFEREAMAAGNIDHPNVATASDFGKLSDGSFFLVLEYVVGQSLRDAVTEGRFELGRALYITRQIASALGRAHALGIVHRDLKPENVMLVSREGDPSFVKVLDFGIAKVPVGDFPSEGPSAGSATLTRMGMVFGTPEYMAPEQALGAVVDGRADLYSLGVVAFEMLTGQRPFDHDNAATLLAMQITAPVPSLRHVAPDADIPPVVEAIIDRLLAKDVANRFASAADLASTLTVTMAELAAQGRVDPALVDRAGASGAMSARAVQAALASPPLASATPVALPRPGLPSPRVLVAIAAGAFTLFMLVIVSSWALFAKTTPTAPAASALPEAALSPSPEQELAERQAAAEAQLDQGDFRGAAVSLLALLETHPAVPALHHDLARALLGDGDVRGGLKEARAWILADPAATRDPKIEEAVKSAAARAHDADDAFDLLESGMGMVGTDLLYDLAYGAGHGVAQDRARASLAKAAVRKNVSPALAVTLDLRSTASCDGKKALFDRARQVGDRRTVAILETLKPTRGCGLFGRKDCWACMHRDGALSDVIGALERKGAP